MVLECGQHWSSVAQGPPGPAGLGPLGAAAKSTGFATVHQPCGWLRVKDSAVREKTSPLQAASPGPSLARDPTTARYWCVPTGALHAACERSAIGPRSRHL